MRKQAGGSNCSECRLHIPCVPDEQGTVQVVSRPGYIIGVRLFYRDRWKGTGMRPMLSTAPQGIK